MAHYLELFLRLKIQQFPFSPLPANSIKSGKSITKVSCFAHSINIWGHQSPYINPAKVLSKKDAADLIRDIVENGILIISRHAKEKKVNSNYSAGIGG